VTLDWTPPVVSGNRLFFAATDPEHGTELWSSDGTPPGTRLVRDIRPGPAGSTISGFADVGGVVLFAADDGESGRELWRSDGTAEGTYLVEDLAPDIYSSNPADFVRSGRQVFFTAAGDGPARPLWKIPSEAVGGGSRAGSTPRLVPPRPF
jgi:ELWxxDGT repeat protein